MMKLTTKYIGDIEGNQVVSWRVGTKRRGIIHISDISDQDVGAVAELVSIRHLLFVEKVFHRDIHSGAGIAIEVSVPVVKKAARKKTSKTTLLKLANFFSTNLQGVTLDNTKSDTDSFLPNPGEDVPSLFISAEDKPQYDVFTTPAMGKLRLNKHAVDQFIERHHSGDSKNPLISLISRLKHEEIKRQPLPDSVLKHKERKYGSVENLEVWGHDTSQLHYTVVRDPTTSIGTVVTVYKRHPQH